jgi:hypothetical protein
MKRSDINPMPDYFDRYINLVADVEISQAFDDSIAQLDALDRDAFARLEGRPYAPGKWSVQGLLQHVLDFERIFNYRALLFARQTGKPPQGLEEDEIAANSRADNRTAADIIDELRAVRVGTKYLYGSFDDQTISLVGKAWNYEISILALGFTSIGHQIHHLNIIKERYFPLLDGE